MHFATHNQAGPSVSYSLYGWGGDLSQVGDLSQGEGFKPGPGLDLASRALLRISGSGLKEIN